ncbi:endonuclease I [Nonlabens tegetincola]|uniref:Endonuclease I n=1 Tax=Nonlabens tegetincola TaxID=323273 RepID=A0A090Q2P4_9FLAO|nr:hypothetical protein [Nonlabens tegetincola]ARN70467.1 hypothetical protein BST91_01750 [Nonlabens tegetincola]GAK97300.1 endonuclease I [Nonlabens tegetincola]
MKKIILALTVCATALFVSCDSEQAVYSGTAVGLNQTSAQVSVPQGGSSETFPVVITTTSDEARTFGLEFIEEPTGGGVSLGSITIPANAYEGTATVNFDFNAITLDDGETDTFSIKAVSDNTDVFGTVLEIDYFKEVICNDATLTFGLDQWGSETGFTIIDTSNGRVVYDISTNNAAELRDNNITTIIEDIRLEDGCYEAVITDSFGDGQDSANSDGFVITCSILTFAEGGGFNFGGEQRVAFCVNQ